jgi:anti-sigma B factor antagonist
MAANPIPQFPLQLSVEKSNDAAIVRCHGKLINETSSELRSVVKPLIPENRRVVLDLSDVQYMDSSGLAALVGLYTSAISSGNCKLQLIDLSPRVRELLRITKLLSVFEPFGEHL